MPGAIFSFCHDDAFAIARCGNDQVAEVVPDRAASCRLPAARRSAMNKWGQTTE